MRLFKNFFRSKVEEVEIIEEEEQEAVTLEELIMTDKLAEILPRLRFQMSLREKYPSVLAGIHNLDLNADLYFTFEFMLSLSGELSININTRYLYQGDTNTKELNRLLKKDELSRLGINMAFDHSRRKMTVALIDNIFTVDFDNSLVGISMSHYVGSDLKSSINKVWEVV